MNQAEYSIVANATNALAAHSVPALLVALLGAASAPVALPGTTCEAHMNRHTNKHINKQTHTLDVGEPSMTNHRSARRVLPSENLLTHSFPKVASLKSFENLRFKG